MQKIRSVVVLANTGRHLPTLVHYLAKPSVISGYPLAFLLRDGDTTAIARYEPQQVHPFLRLKFTAGNMRMRSSMAFFRSVIRRLTAYELLNKLFRQL